MDFFFLLSLFFTEVKGVERPVLYSSLDPQLSSVSHHWVGGGGASKSDGRVQNPLVYIHS